MSVRISSGARMSQRSLSGSAAIESQIAELERKRNNLVSELKNLRANGGDKMKIAALERKIKRIEERIKRLEEQKLASAEQQREQRVEQSERRAGFDEKI